MAAMMSRGSRGGGAAGGGGQGGGGGGGGCRRGWGSRARRCRSCVDSHHSRDDGALDLVAAAADGAHARVVEELPGAGPRAAYRLSASHTARGGRARGAMRRRASSSNSVWKMGCVITSSAPAAFFFSRRRISLSRSAAPGSRPVARRNDVVPPGDGLPGGGRPRARGGAP